MLTKPHYYDDLRKRIARTKEGRIVVAAMTIQPTLPEVQQLLSELGRAAERGVSVTLLVDAINFLVGERRIPGPLFLSTRPLDGRRFIPQFKATYTALQELAAKGGNYIILNTPPAPFSNVYAGRSHMKFAVVNDMAYVGGCNLDSKDPIDVMIGQQNKKLADFLYDLSEKIVAANGNVKEALSFKDVQFSVQDNETLLLDAGVPNQSLIMDTVLKAIDASNEDIFVTTQFFVNEIIAERLLKASQRGVRVRVIYNCVKNHQMLERIMVSSILIKEKRRLPKNFFENVLPDDAAYLHAKILTADDTVFVGSHNYFPLLVRFGTAEICLQTNDKKFTQYVKRTFLNAALH